MPLSQDFHSSQLLGSKSKNTQNESKYLPTKKQSKQKHEEVLKG